MSLEAPSQGAGRPNWPEVWLGLLSLWATFAVLGTWFNYFSLLARGRPISWTQAIEMNLVFYGTWALIITPVVLLLCARKPLERGGLLRLVPAHFLGIAFAACSDVGIKTLLGSRVFPGAQSHPFLLQFRKHLLSESEADIQIYLLVAVVAYVVAYYNRIRAQERLAADLKSSLIRSELQFLKMQLQPHFLFNTLHSVAALVRTDPQSAQRMICSLGDLLRSTLAAEDTPKVPLRRELDFLQTYLDIQKLRFQDRLVVEVHVENEILDATVPYMLLQPLLENAIKHGIARRSGQGRIEVDIHAEIDELRISVVNDNCSCDRAPRADGLGIGLDNIRNRLRILYGFRGHVTHGEVSDERFRVDVAFPLETDADLDCDPQLLPAAG